METIDRLALTFLVNALWQIPLAAIVTYGMCRLMRNAPARHRHVVCVAGLVAALALPLAGLRTPPDRPVTMVAQQIEIPAGAPAAASATVPAAPSRSVPVPRRAADVALWALAAILLVQVVRLIRGAARTAHLCRTAVPQSGRCDVWERCRSAFGLDRAELRWSEELAGPATAGRIVVLPRTMKDAPQEILEAAIGHEAAHVARRDFAASVLCELLTLPISWHPATAWLKREIGRTREMACDELVASRLVAPEEYARSLVTIAGTIAGVGQPGYTLGALDGDILEERVRRLLERRKANLKQARLMVAAGLATLALLGAIASGLAISARAQTPTLEMRAAADAYNRGNYEAAAQHFEKAVALDPANVNARLFLANTYLRLRRNDDADRQYAEVLKRDPRNATAIAGFAALNTATRPTAVHELLMQVVESAPQNKHAYYSIGVVDWGVAYRTVAGATGGLPQHIPSQIADPALRAKLRNEVGPRIEEGFRMLQIAMVLDPEWSPPMAYMNLLYRLKAALVDDPAESAKAIEQADEWVQKALAARRSRPEEKAPAHIDVDGPPPTAIPMMVPAPPPPPPPPPGGIQGVGRVMPPPPPPPPPPGKN